jgi:hypothetical protein
VAEIAGSLAAAIERPISWIHLPVPADRDDASYFAPLKDLALDPTTELYLGLIHERDGAAGTQRRLRAAATAVSGFGIASECGFGRRAPETIPALLQLHSELADPVA